jgi:serine/threonine protein kinase
MGRVFLGLSAGGRPVAVKVIGADLAADPEFRVRFRREVAAARRVSGLFTALVVDADVDGPVPWLATAYVAGPSLAQAVARHGPMAARQALALAAGLAESLSAIHAAGVVHCDLKPSNVLLSQDGPRVIDFGISRAAEAAVTRGGLVIGSPGYMSPEQALGGEIGPPCDVFSLGAVLAFAATGRAPFGRGSAPEVAYRVVYGRPDLDALPGQLRPLIERCLAKDPRQRPTAGDLLAGIGALQPAVGWLPADPDRREPARPRPPRRRARRRARRPLAAAWAGSGLLTAAVVIGLALSGGIGHSLTTQHSPNAPASGASTSPHAHRTASGHPSVASPADTASTAVPAAATQHRSRSARASASSSPSRSASPTVSRSASPTPPTSPSSSPSTSPSPTGSASPTATTTGSPASSMAPPVPAGQGTSTTLAPS